MWARDVAGPVEPRWRRDWPTPGGGIRNDCQGPACRCPARGSRGTRGDRRAGLGAGGARGSRPATHLQGCGWGPSRAEPPGAGSGGLGVCAHWLPEVACHCNHPASVGDRVSAEGAASTGSPPPPPEDPGEQPGPALWRLRSGRLPPWPAVLAGQSWAGSRVRAGATCSARPGNVRLGQGEGGSRGCCLVTRPSCPRGAPAVPRPTSQCRGCHQVWARGHSHADTPHPARGAGLAGRPARARPLHTRLGGQAAGVHVCVPTLVHTHAHSHTYVRTAHWCPRSSGWGRLLAGARPEVHALGPWGPVGSARPSQRLMPALAAASQGLGGAGQGQRQRSNPGHENGHQALGTRDEHPGLTLLHSWQGSPYRPGSRAPGQQGSQRAEPAGLGPGPARSGETSRLRRPCRPASVRHGGCAVCPTFTLRSTSETENRCPEAHFTLTVP